MLRIFVFLSILIVIPCRGEVGTGDYRVLLGAWYQKENQALVADALSQWVFSDVCPELGTRIRFNKAHEGIQIVMVDPEFAIPPSKITVTISDARTYIVRRVRQSGLPIEAPLMECKVSNSDTMECTFPFSSNGGSKENTTLGFYKEAKDPFPNCWNI